MSVVLNESALERLLQTPDGPVGRHLAEGAEKIARAAEAQLSEIVHARFQPEVGFSMTSDANGLRVDIGLTRDSDTARRLAAKLGRIDEAHGWFSFARRAFG